MNKQMCEICGEMAVEHKTQKMEYSYKGESILVAQPGHYCNACGESILDPQDLKATRKELTTFRAQVEHLLTPDEIRNIRKILGISQQEAANICGGGKNAFSRYESGDVLIPRAASNLLKILSKDKGLLSEVSTCAA